MPFAASTRGPDEQRPQTITVREIEQYLGIPASSVRAWTSMGRLTPVGVAEGGDEELAVLRRAGLPVGARGMDVGGPREYKLEDVITLYHEGTMWRRRAAHTRPNRRREVDQAGVTR